jgi:hypothetical protein
MPLAVTARGTRPSVSSSLSPRQPGGGLPAAVRDAAVQAGGRSPRADLALLTRVHDALLRLPESALGQLYFEIPGDCLAFPRGPQESR